MTMGFGPPRDRPAPLGIARSTPSPSRERNDIRRLARALRRILQVAALETAEWHERRGQSTDCSPTVSSSL
jgi:hypothetical protein